MPDRDEASERRVADAEFRQRITEKIDHIERTLFTAEGYSNIRLITERQIDLHTENKRDINRLQRALFTENDESRLAILEKGQAKITEILGRGVFLKQLLVGIFTMLVAGLELWRTFHP